MKDTNSPFKIDKRRFKRLRSKLRAVVQVKESDDETWKEITEVTTVSQNGAEFRLSHDCVIGRLIIMVMPMPVELRLYDKLEKIYPVAAIIQSCYKSTFRKKPVYNIGVAFIGKTLPDSYLEDPLQTYRISGVRADGTWTVVETKTPFQPRTHHRFPFETEVSLTLIQKEKMAVKKEKTKTRDISASGMSLWSTLDIKKDDRIKIACNEYEFYSIAVVRNCNRSKDKRKIAHVEFVDEKFPIDKIAIFDLDSPYVGETVTGTDWDPESEDFKVKLDGS